jgi:hemoglobin/transferrin/lactoferrin receptor protein
MEVRAGVFNLFDETYWRWLDVYRLSADDPMIALLARPGRTYSVSIQYQF